MGKYNCGICKMYFPTKTARRRHKKEKHGGYFLKSIEVKGGVQMVEEKKEEIKTERKSPIQKVAKILVPAEQAKVEWKKYCQLLKTRKDKHLKIMKEAMFFAKQGKQFIDVYEVMKKAGLNKNNEPRLAIARADIHQVYLEKQDSGTFRFCMEKGWNKGGLSDDVLLPQKSFNVKWERLLRADGTPSWEIKDKELVTKVPIIPVDLMPEGDLSSYYILWEVKEWNKLPEPKDPFLLKRISENLFVILGAWDITELERAIIGGLK